MKQFRPFRLDTANQCLWLEEKRVPLTPKAFAVLSYLVDHAPRLVTHEELLDAVWPRAVVQPEVLSSHIRDLRAALGDDSRNPRFIETLARRGYRFIAPVTTVPRKPVRASQRGWWAGRASWRGWMNTWVLPCQAGVRSCL